MSSLPDFNAWCKCFDRHDSETDRLSCFFHPFNHKLMILTTTPTIEGRPVVQYLGVVTSETIIGANIFRDFFASIRDVIGGRSKSYESVLREAKDAALRELQEEAHRLGANAVVGIDLDYETVGERGSMLMVTASGTAVVI